MSVGGDTLWARSNRVLWRRTTRGVALLPPGADLPLTLTGSAALLWDLVSTSISLADTVAALAEQHGVDPATVAADVAPVLDELVRRGVLVPAGGAP